MSLFAKILTPLTCRLQYSVTTLMSRVRQHQLHAIAGHQVAPRATTHLPSSNGAFRSLLSGSIVSCLLRQPVRCKVRVYYKPNALKRVRKHGFAKRCSTRGGVKILWRRFLKGRHKLSI